MADFIVQTYKTLCDALNGEIWPLEVKRQADLCSNCHT